MCRFSIFACENMRKDKGTTQEPKAKCRVRNWTTYNAGLSNRGNITMWIDDDVLANVPDTEPTRGRPRPYSDALVQALLRLEDSVPFAVARLAGLCAKSARSCFRRFACTELHDRVPSCTNAAGEAACHP